MSCVPYENRWIYATKRKKEEKSGDEKQREGWWIRQRMDLREVTLLQRQWWGPCWGSYKGQTHLDGNWLLCVIPHWSSRGYQNIMPERVITTAKEVIKDIKSGRRGARETKKKKKQVRKRQSGKKELEKKINRLLYAALRMCPLAAPDSQSKDFNSQQTNWTSIHRPILIICHPCLSLSLFISLRHTHTPICKHTHTHGHTDILFKLLASLLQI